MAPNDWKRDYERGRKLQAAGKYREALPAFDEALEKAPPKEFTVEAQYCRAYSFYRLDRFPECDDACRSALALDPKHKPTSTLRHHIASKLKPSRLAQKLSSGVPGKAELEQVLKAVLTVGWRGARYRWRNSDGYPRLLTPRNIVAKFTIEPARVGMKLKSDKSSQVTAFLVKNRPRHVFFELRALNGPGAKYLYPVQLRD